MGISAKAAAVISIVMEAILYGFSLFLFGVTMWALTYQASLIKVNRPMMIAALLLFVLGTMHMVVDINHCYEGFIKAPNPDLFFDDVSKETFKNSIYFIQTLVGDAIVIYRAFLVWQNPYVVILPCLGYCSVIVAGIHTCWSVAQLSGAAANAIFLQETGKWIITFYASTLSTNLLATLILAYKLWSVHIDTTKVDGYRNRQSPIYAVLVVVLECGALYSVSLIAMLATYLSASNGVYIVMDMIGQIIPITFDIIIVRAALVRIQKGSTTKGITLSTMSFQPSPNPHHPSSLHPHGPHSSSLHPGNHQKGVKSGRSGMLDTFVTIDGVDTRDQTLTMDSDTMVGSRHTNSRTSGSTTGAGHHHQHHLGRQIMVFGPGSGNESELNPSRTSLEMDQDQDQEKEKVDREGSLVFGEAR